MANAITLKKERDKSLNKMRKHTRFTTKLECENIARVYDQINNTKPIPRDPFRDFLGKYFGITDDKLLDRVFKVFDTNNDNVICLEEWFNGLSIVLRGSKEEQSKFTFHVYDNNNDGVISREEMHLYLKQSLDSGKSVADEDPDEGVSELIDLIRKKFNPNTQDQNVTINCYKDVVINKDEWLLLEFLGPCMPSEEHVMDFEENIVKAGLNKEW